MLAEWRWEEDKLLSSAIPGKHQYVQCMLVRVIVSPYNT